MKILIVDDDPQITEMIQEFLEVFDHDVQVMNHIPVEILTEEYDLLLADCNLNGTEYFHEHTDYLTKISSRYSFFFTGAPQRLGLEAMKSGHGIIQKPIDLDSLLQLLQFLDSSPEKTNQIDKKRFKRIDITLFDWQTPILKAPLQH